MTVMTLGAGAARAVPRAFAAILLALVAGCATAPAERHVADGGKDPWEPFNRKVFAFNDHLDTYALKPAARAYQAVLPTPVQKGIHNFFGNFSDAWSAVNKLLQGKIEDSAVMTARFVTNSTIGIAGLFDPATELGLDRRSADFGLTLGHWGLEPGPYVVLPLFGSSDFRDGLALPADTYVTPALLVPTFWQGLAVDAVGAVDARASLLGASQMLDELAFDRYTFMRDAYVTRRRSLVYDGNPPPLPGEDDEDDKSAPAPAGAASQTRNGLKPALPATAPAKGDKTSMSSDAPQPLAMAVAQEPASGVQPAPLPASAPRLPLPLPGPAPVPPPPASAPRA
jgi:phospholipid-binding lipoprotein MlaA